ncbi:hypothetical protein QAD02_002086 [Eretmocerus hayati]|uniref:Uncharacterized protein n=1 Tax=Eretmocerus hayati TaxID=131215 RepID=A0ACC2NKT3_9HYME|nr:hypothetical protein QAD02_002086 [Eretmocerus hayati]
MSRSFGKCCNPLDDATGHSKALCNVSERILIRFPSLDSASKICDKCSKRIDLQESTEARKYQAIIQNMIDEFSNGKTSKRDRDLIMSLLPKDWSIRRRADFFGATKHFVTSTNKAFTKTTVTRNLSDETARSVEEFYQDDRNSRIISGMKDVVCLKDKNGQKVYAQKRLVLSTLRELYISFKDSHPEIKIGFSKFAQFRPKHCVWAGSSGTHTVCMCIYHQNVKLILEGMDVSKLTSEKVNDYKECISLIVCEKLSNECFLSQCLHCPGVEPLKNLLLESFNQKEIDQVQFQFRLSTDRCKLQIRVTSAEEFVEELVKLVFELKTHAFTAKQQASFLQWLKDNLKGGEFLILMDFAETYAFLIQDAV